MEQKFCTEANSCSASQNIRFFCGNNIQYWFTQQPAAVSGSQQYSVASFGACSELSSLTWTQLFMLQRCTILLWPLSIQICDGYYNICSKQNKSSPRPITLIVQDPFHCFSFICLYQNFVRISHLTLVLYSP